MSAGKLIYGAVLLLALGCAPEQLVFDGARDAAADGRADARVDADTPDTGPALTATWITAGGGTTCAALSDDTVRCWGANSYGQLALGSTDSLPHSRPVVVPALHDAAEVKLSSSHGCAIWKAGGAACWGVNGRGWNGEAGGKLGLGTVDDCQMPDCAAHALPEAVIDLVEPMQIAVGFNHTCAVTSSGSVRCWGSNREDAVGLGTADDDPHPVPDPTYWDATGVAVGDLLTCVVSSERVACWGYNQYGQAPLPQSKPIGVTDGAVQVAAYWLHACVRDDAGLVKCWGYNAHGQLGSGSVDATPHPVPELVPDLTGVVDLSVGNKHGCAATLDGAARCWGWDEYGQLGNGTEGPEAFPPVAVVGVSDAVQVVAGDEHACARSREGRVWCWGANQDGQLGDGTTDSTGTPREVLW